MVVAAVALAELFSPAALVAAVATILVSPTVPHEARLSIPIQASLLLLHCRTCSVG